MSRQRARTSGGLFSVRHGLEPHSGGAVFSAQHDGRTSAGMFFIAEQAEPTSAGSDENVNWRLLGAFGAFRAGGAVFALLLRHLVEVGLHLAILVRNAVGLDDETFNHGLFLCIRRGHIDGIHHLDDLLQLRLQILAHFAGRKSFLLIQPSAVLLLAAAINRAPLVDSQQHVVEQILQLDFIQRVQDVLGRSVANEVVHLVSLQAVFHVLRAGVLLQLHVGQVSRLKEFVSLRKGCQAAQGRHEGRQQVVAHLVQHLHRVGERRAVTGIHKLLQRLHILHVGREERRQT